MNFVTVSDKEKQKQKNKLTTRFKKKQKKNNKRSRKSVPASVSVCQSNSHTKKYFSQLILLLAPPQFQLSSILRSEKKNCKAL